ncbi:hypothetical protein E4T56_gene9081 [Termitomyces sp. T112]|nr:hypothetical protein E4T56_gene9081 [Termitomyces sp. T112]
MAVSLTCSGSPSPRLLNHSYQVIDVCFPPPLTLARLCVPIDNRLHTLGQTAASLLLQREQTFSGERGQIRLSTIDPQRRGSSVRLIQLVHK